MRTTIGQIAAWAVLVVCLLGTPSAGAREGDGPIPAAPAGGQARGPAAPDDDAWGDEWFDEMADRPARKIEAEMVREATRAAPAERPAAAPPPPPSPRPSARQLTMPAHGVEALEAAWRERREALLRRDRTRAKEAERRLLRLQAELDVRELHAIAAAAARESRKLEGAAPREALEVARLAVALAPSLPLAHYQLLRAQLAADPTALGAIAGAAWNGLAAGLHDPRDWRLLVLDLAAAAIGAVLISGLVALLMVGLPRSSILFHDFHHLFPRGVSRWQTGLLLALSGLLPAALGFGPLALAALALAAFWLYLERGERIALGVWLAVAAALPAGAGALATRMVWDGTPAASLYAVEHTGDFRPLPAILEKARAGNADPITLFVAARARKRLGDLAEAESLYRRALERRPIWPAAMVNLANVLFLRGDLDGALRLYTRAVELAPGLAAAHFGLSRLHYDRVDIAAGQAARARAVELEPSLVERYSLGDEGRAPANQYVIDVALAREELDAVAAGGAEGEEVRRQLASLLVGPVAFGAIPWAGAAWVAAVATTAFLLRRRIRISSSCSRCGRPLCLACDPEASGGTLCGQCINVFGRRAALEPGARERKERMVRLHQIWQAFWCRLGALLLAGRFQNGRVVTGTLLLVAGWFLLLLVLFPSGLVRPLFDGLPAAWKWAALAPPLVGLYVASWRGARGGS